MGRFSQFFREAEEKKSGKCPKCGAALSVQKHAHPGHAPGQVERCTNPHCNFKWES